MATASPKPRRTPADQHRVQRACTSCTSRELLKRPVVTGSIRNRIGKLTDLVFQQAEPFPELVGIYIDHGWGKPTEFIPWDKVVKIEEDAVFVQPRPESGYPPFVDQPGWILVDKHLMGRTILDIDGRRIEVVNDVRLLDRTGRLLLVDVDLSFNGFLRRWGLGSGKWVKDRLISWKYVQPLSLEDAVPTDRVKLSVTKRPAAGPARRGPGRRPGRAVRQGAAGAVLGPRSREGGRDAERGRAARAAAD